MFGHIKQKVKNLPLRVDPPSTGYRLVAHDAGFTLIEILIAICIFIIVGTGVYMSYANILDVIGRTRTHTLASSLINKQIEMIRNLPYDSVGISGGYPVGVLPASTTITYEGQDFVIEHYVRNVDDGFDGFVSGGNVAFQYAAQVGAGGITMANQGKITGNVYTNGSLLGGGAGGVTGSVWVAGNNQIQNTTVTGTARANTISGSTINGSAYYQTLSNSTVTGTKYPGSTNPTPGSLPISQSHIDSWKNDAAAGGTYVGNYTLNGSSAATIGPLKIQGNLTISSNAVLTLAGKVWVTGTISLANNGAIQLASSYGSKSGTIVADGTISMTNSSNICGSEGFNTSAKACNTANNSFVLLVSTNNGNPAINLQNSATMRGIMFALSGYVTVGNSAVVREASGYGLNITNSSQVLYDSALASVNTGSSSVDTAPADYKLVELQVSCPTCFHFVPLVFTTWVAPQNLETSTKNGSLFVSTFDANGQSVGNVDVLVKNTSLAPTITINDSTNNAGLLQLIDIPTSTSAYQVTVSKDGYTSRQTYTPGATANPNPVQPHATVAPQQITALSFAIDKVSTINVKTHDQYCAAVPSIDMTQNGQKLIGTGPNVLLYSNAFATDAAGASARTNLEWDTYSFINNDTAYDLAGSIPAVPLTINPDVVRSLGFLMEPKTTNSLLVTVTGVTGSPISDATVTLTKTGFNQSKLTGEKFYTKTDWSGGQYAAQDGNISDNSPSGELRLALNGSGVYPTSTDSFIESDTIDFGTSTRKLYDLGWTPTSQSSGTTLKFQLASAQSEEGPWSYIGPDGTSGTYFTATSTLGTVHDGRQYLRYKAYFNTTNSAVTPKLQDVSIGFASGCVPSGQTFWPGLTTGTYTVTVSKSGYTNVSTQVTVGAGWQELALTLQ